MSQLQNQFKKQIRITKTQLLQSYTNKLQLMKTQIENMNQQNEDLSVQIKQELIKLKETTTKLKQKLKGKINSYCDSLNDQGRDQDIIQLTQLSKYLKLQKQCLKLLIGNANKIQPVQDLHNLLCRSRFQKLLKTIKKLQIEQQIKYLQSNVLSRGNLIYDVSSSNLSANEQKQMNAKLQNMLEELERLVNLGVICQKPSNKTHLQSLSNQQRRLKQAENLLDIESNKFNQIIKFLEYQIYSCINQLPLPVSHFIDQPNDKSDVIPFNKKIQDYQLDSIINFEIPKNNQIISFEHNFEAIEERIIKMKVQIKKIQNKL